MIKVENWKNWQIILFIALCVCLNVGGKLLAVWLELPLWADSFGTVLCAYVAGPVCGALVGVTGNIAYGTVNHLSAVYSITSIALAIIIGIAANKRWFDRFYGFMTAATLAMLTALVVSVPIDMLFDDGYTGNKWGNGVVDYLQDKEWPIFLCCILGQLAIEFADKVLTIAAVYVVIRIRRARERRDREKTLEQSSAGAALIALVMLCVGLAVPVSVSADSETRDYNDYVQSVYSSNNGLPCGEANDIAQTNDGVLWIGTYAGLYRYNGREFRWIDNYESVKNVNCLYVDEEGRLWIGTNDNGLTIVIREKAVNVLDHESGLPSNSVRSIVRASDGYYYIGTSTSMQMIAMNNGLKVEKTLDEVNYAESITANNKGHVATVAASGTLFLLKNGEIVNSITLPEHQEVFNCCTFAPDGTLMAGTSTNHIYCFDIDGGDFRKLKVINCEGLSGINSLDYINDGTLFISSDSGVAYLDGSGYHKLNTNEFPYAPSPMVATRIYDLAQDELDPEEATIRFIRGQLIR